MYLAPNARESPVFTMVFELTWKRSRTPSTKARDATWSLNALPVWKNRFATSWPNADCDEVAAENGVESGDLMTEEVETVAVGADADGVMILAVPWTYVLDEMNRINVTRYIFCKKYVTQLV